MQNGTPRTVPRAFYPEYMHRPPPAARTPGWDVGPEQRVGDEHTLRRVLGWSGIGITALGFAFLGERARTSRMFAAVALVAGAAGLDLLLSRQPSWAEDASLESDES